MLVGRRIRLVKHLTHLRKNEALAVIVCSVFIFLIYLMGIDVTAAVVGTTSICGNGACEVGETYISCKQDCSAVCGNGVCETVETINCPVDCKEGNTETKAVAFNTSLVFVILSAIIIVIVLFPISIFGTSQKVRKLSRRRRRR